MTDEEIREKAKKLKLDEKVVDYILKEFANAREIYDERLRDEDEEYAQIVVGTKGRAAWGQSWEHSCEEMAIAMGVDEDKAWDAGPCGEDKQVNKVWAAFFEE